MACISAKPVIFIIFKEKRKKPVYFFVDLVKINPDIKKDTDSI